MKHRTSIPENAVIPKGLRTVVADSEDDLSLVGDGGLDPMALRAVIERAIKDAVLDGKPFDVELEFITAKGNFQCVHATGRADRERGKLFGTFEDITERKQAESAVAESQGQLKAIFDAAGDGILLADIETMKFRSANTSICRMLGYSQEQMLNLSVSDIHPKENLSNAIREFERQASGDSVIAADVPMRRKDGSVFFADINSTRVSLGGKNYLLGFFRDITERKHSEDGMLRAISALKALSQCNKALVLASEENWLLNEICRIIVVTAGCRFAWVGMAEHDAQKTVRPVADAGYIEGFMERSGITWGDCGSGQGPAGAAIRTRQPQLVQDAHTEPSYELWRDSAYRSGYQSVLCLPLASADAMLGALCIYKADRDGFDVEEIRLLSGLASDLAFGILNLRARAAHERSAQRLERSMESTVQMIAATVEIRDPYTAGHQNRVAQLAAAIAREMALPDDRIHGLHLASIVHDVGKIQIPAEILSKPTRLTEIEYEIIKTHAQAGYDILKDVDFPWPIAEIVWQHHERLDGSGYPRGLKADDILFEAKILAIADTIEAMSAARPYRPAVGINAALKEIARGRGTQYDAAAADACLRLFDEKRFAFNELRAGAMI